MNRAAAIAVAFLLSFPSLLFGQDPDIVSLIRALHSDDVRERERASADLLKLGSRAVPALRTVAGGGDAEAAARARQLLGAIRVRRLSKPIVARVDNPFAPFGRADHFQVSPDGEVGFGCDLESIYAWTLPEGRLIRAWPAHSFSIGEMALSPDGQLLLSRGKQDREMTLWEAASGRRLQTYASYRSVPTDIVVAAGGDRLALADGDVEWIEAATGRVLWSWNSPRHAGSAFTLDVSPDGRTIVAALHNDPRLSVLNERGEFVRAIDLRANSPGVENRVRMTDDGTGVVVDHYLAGARLYDLNTGELKSKVGVAERFTLLGRKRKFVVVVPGRKAPEGDALKLELEKADSIQETTLTSDERYVLVRTLNGRSITCFDLTRDNRRIAIGKDVSCFAAGPSGVLTGTRSGDVILHDYEGRELKSVRQSPDPVTFVAFAGASRVAALSADLAFRCWDLDSGRELWRRDFMDFRAGPIRFHPDGRRAFCVFQGRNYVSELALWELGTRRILRRYGHCEGFMRGLAVSPDGRLVAVSGRGGFLAVWEVESGKRLWGAPAGRMINCLHFTPDAASLILAAEDGRVERRASDTGAEQATLQEAGPRVLSLALSGNGSVLATSGDQGPMSIFDVNAGKKLHAAAAGGPPGFIGDHTVITPSARISVKTGDVAMQPAQEIVRVAAIDDTRTRIAVSGTYSKRAVIADVVEGRLLGEARAPFLITHVALGMKGTRAVLIQNEGDGAAAGFAVGTPEPDWQSKGWTSGIDPARGLIFELQNDGMHVFDMKVRKEVSILKGTVDGPLIFPSGSPHAYGAKHAFVRELDLATLRETRELPELSLKKLRTLDADPAGEALLEGLEFLDAQTGAVLHKIDVKVPGLSRESVIAQSFFGKDGERIYLVTSRGLVITLVEGE